MRYKFGMAALLPPPFGQSARLVPDFGRKGFLHFAHHAPFHLSLLNHNVANPLAEAGGPGPEAMVVASWTALVVSQVASSDHRSDQAGSLAKKVTTRLKTIGLELAAAEHGNDVLHLGLVQPVAVARVT